MTGAALQLILGPVDALTLIALRRDFAAEARRISESLSGHERHAAFDRLSNSTLRALGFGEGVNVFEQAIADWHATPSTPS